MLRFPPKFNSITRNLDKFSCILFSISKFLTYNIFSFVETISLLNQSSFKNIFASTASSNLSPKLESQATKFAHLLVGSSLFASTVIKTYATASRKCNKLIDDRRARIPSYND